MRELLSQYTAQSQKLARKEKAKPVAVAPPPPPPPPAAPSGPVTKIVQSNVNPTYGTAREIAWQPDPAVCNPTFYFDNQPPSGTTTVGGTGTPVWTEITDGTG
eukprot:2270787-Prymnesium_polylepis.1